MIKLDNVEKVYRTSTVETVALSRINMHVTKGEFVTIMGPSGSGKSTLLNIIGLLDIPTKGNIVIDRMASDNLTEKELAHLRNRKLGFVFQSYHLITDLNVLDNVQIPLLYRKLSGAKRKRKALHALEKVGLTIRSKHFPNQLSGGQMQRVAIARAIVGSPEIILADEPTGNLDSTMGDEIMDILLNLNRDENTTILMVTHNENLSRKTNRIIRLFDGRQVHEEIL